MLLKCLLQSLRKTFEMEGLLLSTFKLCTIVVSYEYHSKENTLEEYYLTFPLFYWSLWWLSFIFENKCKIVIIILVLTYRINKPKKFKTYPCAIQVRQEPDSYFKPNKR